MKEIADITKILLNLLAKIYVQCTCCLCMATEKVLIGNLNRNFKILNFKIEAIKVNRVNNSSTTCSMVLENPNNFFKSEMKR